MAQPAAALTIYEQVEQSPVVKALDDQTAQLMDLLPDEQAVARFKRGVVVAIAKNPDLLECTPQSIVLACFEAAQQGLEPTGASGGAHLVPYNVNVAARGQQARYEKRAQLIPDYRGVIRLVTNRPSEVASIEARVVKEGDEFSYQLGTEAWVNHVPALDAGRSAKATTHVYAIARLKSGVSIPDVEDRAGVERVRARARRGDNTPWGTDWDEMGKKTLIKRLSKVLPVRPEIRAILVREDELAGEVDADAPAVAAPTGPTRAAQLGSRIRRPRTVTPEVAPPPAIDEPAPADEVAGQPDPTAVEPLTLQEFVGLIEAEGLDKQVVGDDGRPHYLVAERIRLERWPDPGYELTPEDRARVLAELRDRKASLL